MFLYVCKQTFCKIYRYITRQFLGIRMRNFQRTIFAWTWRYREIFKSALCTIKLEKNFHKVWSVFVNKLLNGGFTWNCVIYKGKIEKYRSSRPEMFCKKSVLRNFERDSGTGFFLWILQNFKVQLFLQNTSGGSF